LVLACPIFDLALASLSRTAIVDRVAERIDARDRTVSMLVVRAFHK